MAVSYLANRRLPSDAEGREARRQLARTAGLAGFALSLIHVLTSFAILTEARYPLLFTRGELSGFGLVCLGSGALATALFAVPAVPAVYSIRRLAGALGTEGLRHAQQLGYVGLALTAVHALAVGLPNWFAPSRWPGGLPPISMISFWVCLAPIGARLVSARLRGRTARPEPLLAVDPID